MFSYIGRYKTITYIGQYKPTSLKSFQYYIYRSIYADKRHISIHICNISWFKLGAYIGPIYIRSYNDRYIKTYILPEYVSIYRSIFDIIYWPIYDDRILTDICILFKNHFLIDICRNFAFFDRYMKIFIFSKIAILDFCSMFRSIKTSYIGQYKNPYIGLYKNVYKTLGDLAYIDLYTPYRFAA